MTRKKVTETSNIPVVTEAPKAETNNEIATSMEKYSVFARSIFGDDYQVGVIKVKRGQPDPKTITMLKVEKEFIIAQKGRHNSEKQLRLMRSI